MVVHWATYFIIVIAIRRWLGHCTCVELYICIYIYIYLFIYNVYNYVYVILKKMTVMR